MIGGSIVSSPQDGLDKLAKQARAVLVVLAVVQLVGGVMSYVAGAIPDVTSLALTLAPGLVFAALAVWASKDPLPAVLVGAGIWVVLIGAAAAVDPTTLFAGLILKAVVVVLFITGISTGMTYNRLRHTIGASR
jgi:hypothetical protein